MNTLPPEDSAISDAENELRQLLEQTEDARTALTGLQHDMVEAGKHLEQADGLLLANEQLVIASLRAQADSEVATNALENVARAAELDVVIRASKSKSEFLSRVSHELRTPLNAILGFGQLMLMDDDENGYLDPSQRERLEAIRLAGQQLLLLTNDMLDLARIEQGRVRIDMKVVDVYTLVCSSELLLRPSAMENHVEVRNANKNDECFVMADERALSQVLLNLMSNAIKYNQPGGLVTVRTEVRIENVVILVQDNGLGMSEAQLVDLFQPFNRLGAESSMTPGSGLGLVISKALVELMGGKLAVSSLAGVGTTMEIHLPHAAKHLRESSTDDGLNAASPSMHTITAPGTILYVEDNPVNVMIMKQLFALEPAWSLLIATTGQAGIDLATAQRPDLIILDMQLPDMTGLQVFAALQIQKLLPARGCIALSADAMPDHVQRAIDAGFTQYWTKPLELRPAMQKLRELLTSGPC
ncbi:MAG: ATP-binding protein [Spongiibacteraceae bacterium]